MNPLRGRLHPWGRLGLALAFVTGVCALAAPAQAQRVFWLDTSYDAPALRSSRVDGTDLRTLSLPAGSLPEGLALDRNAHVLYWGDGAWTGAAIHRAVYDFSGSTTLVTGQSCIHDLAVDPTGGHLYWLTMNWLGAPAVVRSNLDGGSPQRIVTLGATTNPRGLTIDTFRGKLYWTDYDNGTFSSCNLDGTSAASVASVLGGTPWGIAMDLVNGRLYVASSGSGEIVRCNTNGSSMSVVHSGLSDPTYLAANDIADSLVWCEDAVRIAHGYATSNSNLTVSSTLATYGGVAEDDVNFTAVPGLDAPPSAFALGPASPTPATGDVTLSFALPEPAEVSLAVVDVQGRLVRTLRDGPEPAGRQSVTWNTRDGGAPVAPGVYFARLVAGGHTLARRLVIAR